MPAAYAALYSRGYAVEEDDCFPKLKDSDEELLEGK